MIVPELRPLGVGELIDVAIKIWRRHLWTLIRIVLVIVAPVQVLSGLIFLSVTPDEAFFETNLGPTTGTSFGDFPSGGPDVDGGDVAGFLAGGLTAALLPLLATLLAVAATLRAVSIAYLGGQPDWKESLTVAARRLGSLIWLAVLWSIGLTLASLFFVLPGIWLWAAWSTAFAVLVAEGRGGTEALRRSFSLVRGRWWPTFGTLVLAVVLYWVVSLLVGLPLSLVAIFSETGSVLGILTSTAANVVSSVIATPLPAAILVLVYFDLRVRKEGFDLELLARAIGSGSLPGEGGPGGWAPPAPPAGWAPPSADRPAPPGGPAGPAGPAGWPPPSESS